jgi:hypothetical protein
MISVNKSAAQKSGFILVEALIAVGLLVTAFGAISQASSLSLEGFRTAKSNYIAGKIAQEGIELVINKRDNHVQCVNSDDSCPINQCIRISKVPGYLMQRKRTNFFLITHLIRIPVTQIIPSVA